MCDTPVYPAGRINLFRVIRVLGCHIWYVLRAQVTKERAQPSEPTSRLFPVPWSLCITSLNKYPKVLSPLPSYVSTWPSLRGPGPVPAPQQPLCLHMEDTQ